MFNFFAATEGVPVSAEPLFQIGGLTVTNSMLMGALVGLLVVCMFVAAAIKSTIKPHSKYAFFIESVVQFMVSTLSANFAGDEKKARKFLPLFLAFFVFILLNNLFGLLPGMGGSVYAITGSGVKEALLRPFTTDLNGTLALAVIAISTVQYYAVRERGLFGHIKHYFSVTKPWWNPMNAFLGPIEIISEITRLITLALRLFGVIYAGEVLLHVITQLAGNFAFIGTIPIVLMEIFFASLQAYLFIMLSSVYLQMGTTHEEPSESHSPAPIAKTAAGEAG
jgi:F-type H+-transporting ATPase subunit a